jgi:hypothetical protein
MYTSTLINNYVGRSYSNLIENKSYQLADECVKQQNETEILTPFSDFLNGLWIGVDTNNSTIKYKFCFTGNKLERQSNYEDMFPEDPVIFSLKILDGKTAIINFIESNNPENFVVLRHGNNSIMINSNNFVRKISK